MNKVLLEKYFEGRATHDETEQVLEWLQTPEGQRYLKNEIEQDIRAFDEFGEFFEEPDLDSDQLFNRIQRSKSRQLKRENRSRSNTGLQWRKAASILLLVGLLGLFVFIFFEMLDPEKRIVETKPGEEKTLFLPDSSKVILHSNSHLEYFTDFDSREVQLEGVAYFEVEHSNNEPFMVFVDNSYVKVLGTKFVVSRYTGSERIEVAVKNGRVEMGSNATENEEIHSAEQTETEDPEKKIGKIEITNDEVGVRSKDSSPFISDSTFSDELFDWLEGKMIFRSTPLRQVFNELENRFGVQFVLNDPNVANKKFTSSFDDESLTEVLEVLTLSLNINYSKEGNKIYISD